MSLFHLSVVFILESRYQRERAAAPWPWPDTPEHRRDWLDGVFADFCEFIDALDEPIPERVEHRANPKVAGRQPTNEDNDCG